MIVHKFGGTALGDAERIRRAARLVAQGDARPVIVVSALATVTDRLMDLAQRAAQQDADAVRAGVRDLREYHGAVADALLTTDAQERAAAVLDAIIDRLRARSDELVAASAAEEGNSREVARLTDAIGAMGEDLAVELVVEALSREGLTAQRVDARDVVRTDDRFGRAVPNDDVTAQLVREIVAPVVDSGAVPVLQGFVGATEDRQTTTLGRGGSDFTAAIVGAALGASEVSIWTDVDGVSSADPRHVPEARVLPELGYEEAVELAYFGARVVHPAAAKHAAPRQVSLRIRNALRPESAGTLIRHDLRRAVGVAAVAHKPGVTLIQVRSRPLFMAYGFLARVFDVLARHRLPVDLVATSHTSTAMTIDASEGLDAICSELEEFAEVEIVEGLATISVVGHGLLQEPGIVARVFSTLGTTPVHLISQASDVSLSFLVSDGVASDVVRGLHSALIEEREPGGVV